MVRDVRFWRGAIGIALAAVTPWGAWATNESTLRAAIVVSIIGALTAAHGWLTEWPSTENVARGDAKLAALPVPDLAPAARPETDRAALDTVEEYKP